MRRARTVRPNLALMDAMDRRLRHSTPLLYSVCIATIYTGHVETSFLGPQGCRAGNGLPPFRCCRVVAADVACGGQDQEPLNALGTDGSLPRRRVQ